MTNNANAGEAVAELPDAVQSALLPPSVVQGGASRTRVARPRAHNRHTELLQAAACVFKHCGYALTTMRAIAAASGMTPGAIYYHYPSKGDLFLAVYEEGVARACAAFDGAVAATNDGWSQLECGMRAHLELMVGLQSQHAPYAGVFVQVQPRDFPAEHRSDLISLRNGYEQRFRKLIESLPLKDGIDRRLLRLQLVGSLNHVPIWFRHDGASTPADIARSMTRHFQMTLGRPDDQRRDSTANV